MTAPDQRVGRVVDGKYRVDRVLTRTPLGDVYVATHVRIDRVVALQHVPTRPGLDGAELAGRVQHGRSNGTRYEHGALLGLSDLVKADDGELFAVRDRLTGALPLSEWLAAREPLDPEAAVTLLSPIVAALAGAHVAGLVHAAVGPASVLITKPDGAFDAKLVDAWFAPDEAMRFEPRAQRLSLLRFLAPEQILGFAPTPASDCWALGMLLHACLTGRSALPIADDAPAGDVAIAIVRGRAVPCDALRPSVPPELAAIVRRALCRDASQRFPHAGAMAAALRGVERAPRVPAIASTSPRSVALRAIRRVLEREPAP